MVRKPNPALIDEDAPELTDAELADMRPASQVLPADVFAALTRRKPGQRGPSKKPALVPLTIRVEPQTLATLKALGGNWQKQVREVLEREAPRLKSRG